MWMICKTFWCGSRTISAPGSGPFIPHTYNTSKEEIQSIHSTYVLNTLPVAQRAMKVCTCLRIRSSLSTGSGSFLIICSMKSFGVTAARFHFNLPKTTSSHSCKYKSVFGSKTSTECIWLKWHKYIIPAVPDSSLRRTLTRCKYPLVKIRVGIIFCIDHSDRRLQKLIC